MGTLKIERIGGLGGFGGSHLKSRGEHLFESLSATDQATVDNLFTVANSSARNMRGGSQMRDGFNYRISRDTSAGIQTIEVPESMVPEALKSSVEDLIE